MITKFRRLSEYSIKYLNRIKFKIPKENTENNLGIKCLIVSGTMTIFSFGQADRQLKHKKNSQNEQ